MDYMSKVIFFDIDGTLVGFDGKMPQSTVKALKAAKEQGHHIVICTGRSKCQIYPWLLDYGFEGIVAASGAYVEYAGQVLLEQKMEQQALTIAVQAFQQADALYFAQTTEKTIATPDCLEKIFANFRKRGIGEEGVTGLMRIWEADSNIAQRQDVEKLAYQNANRTVATMQEQLQEYFDVTAMSFENPDDTSGEVTARGINKAYGMEQYIQYLGMTREDTIAFGDGPNDMEMLQFARIGIAMGNAREELKAVADYVTEDITADGIANAMHRFQLI